MSLINVKRKTIVRKSEKIIKNEKLAYIPTKLDQPKNLDTVTYNGDLFQVHGKLEEINDYQVYRVKKINWSKDENEAEQEFEDAFHADSVV